MDWNVRANKNMMKRYITTIKNSKLKSLEIKYNTSISVQKQFLRSFRSFPIETIKIFMVNVMIF